MEKETKKAWAKLSSQDDIDKSKGLIRGTDEQESAKRFKAHLDYCKKHLKDWKQ
jgi:hypothetical protein